MFYPPPPSVPRVVYIADLGDLPFSSKTPSRMERFLFNRSGGGVRIEKPFGLATDDTSLYVCDTKSAVVHVFDLAAKRHHTLGASGAGGLVKPLAVAIDERGDRYVADLGRREIVVFDAGGEAVRALRATGVEAFEPVDVALRGGELFVLNRAAHRVEVMDPQRGDLIRRIPEAHAGEGRSSDSTFGILSGLGIDEHGRLYLADSLSCVVHRLDARGAPGHPIGRPGDRAGEFARPKHLAIGPHGILYVVDAAFQCVQMFDEAGRCLMLFGGSEGRPGDLIMPAGIAVSKSLLPYLADRIPDGFVPEYLIFVSDQFGPWGVRVYAFGKGSA